MTTDTTPHTNIDLFSDEILTNPYPHYAQLRAQGPVVHLDRHQMWALTHYEVIRNVLHDWETYSSQDGTALNDAKNAKLRGTVLASDGQEHDRLRAVLSTRLAPKALHGLRRDIETRADDLVLALAARGTFDAVEDLARTFAVSVVAELIGVPDDAVSSLLPWADATFQTFGPDNERTETAAPLSGAMFAWLATLDATDFLPGSMGRAVFEAAERGEIERASCVPLLGAYVVAGMDTTINAISNAIFLLATHPDQWALLRDDANLLAPTLNEVLRFDSPVQAFTRTVRAEQRLGEIRVRPGERVLVLYGSGNRDAAKYPDADRFEIRRNPLDHLSFGYGTHGCAGQGLARVESLAVLGALRRHVEKLEVGTPQRHLNNVIRGFGRLPVTVTAAAR
ncbi:cytochrome P450 [Rhodococcus koreensis]|uniref:cytochrome P450 n=1 Tax=Rhodococcus koreensis TaxID=99653 RepID=UPI003671B44D